MIIFGQGELLVLHQEVDFEGVVELKKQPVESLTKRSIIRLVACRVSLSQLKDKDETHVPPLESCLKISGNYLSVPPLINTFTNCTYLYHNLQIKINEKLSLQNIFEYLHINYRAQGFPDLNIWFSMFSLAAMLGHFAQFVTWSMNSNS